jgi:hypothetical protein
MSLNPLPETVIELIKTLHSAGQPHESISQETEVSLELVRKVLDQIDDPQRMQEILMQAQEQQKSLRYRCSHSDRLMRSPVEASNKKLYEKRCSKLC